MAARLEQRAAEAAQPRTRLESTVSERSTVEQEAQRLRKENGHFGEELQMGRGEGLWARLFGS